MYTEHDLYIDNLPTKPADVLTIDTSALQWAPESYRGAAARWMQWARMNPNISADCVQIARAMNRAYIAARRAEREAAE